MRKLTQTLGAFVTIRNYSSSRTLVWVSVVFLCALLLPACTKTKPAAKLASHARSRPPHAYVNPVYSGSMPDPSVIRHNGVYYAFGTTNNERTRDGRVFTVLRSRDLVNWQRLGGALLPPSSAEAVQYWAPEV